MALEKTRKLSWFCLNKIEVVLSQVFRNSDRGDVFLEMKFAYFYANSSKKIVAHIFIREPHRARCGREKSFVTMWRHYIEHCSTLASSTLLIQ